MVIVIIAVIYEEPLITLQEGLLLVSAITMAKKKMGRSIRMIYV